MTTLAAAAIAKPRTERPAYGATTAALTALKTRVTKVDADITAPIYTVELLGDATLVTIRSGDALVTVKAEKTFRGAIGQAIGFAVPRPACHLFSAETGARLSHAA